MTTLAAMLGALPLALGAGDGAEIRRPLGLSIVGGLIFSQVLTLYTTPVVYLHLDRVRSWFARRLAAQTSAPPSDLDGEATAASAAALVENQAALEA